MPFVPLLVLGGGSSILLGVFDLGLKSDDFLFFGRWGHPKFLDFAALELVGGQLHEQFWAQRDGSVLVIVSFLLDVRHK